MAAQDFSFAKKDDGIRSRQAVIAVQGADDAECLSDTLKKRRCRVLGQSQDFAEIAELLRKHKTGLFFLDFDIPTLSSEDFISSLGIKYPNIKVIVLAKTMSKEQITHAKSHNIKRFLAKPLTANAINKLLSGASF